MPGAWLNQAVVEESMHPKERPTLWVACWSSRFGALYARRDELTAKQW